MKRTEVVIQHQMTARKVSDALPHVEKSIFKLRHSACLVHVSISCVSSLAEQRQVGQEKGSKGLHVANEPFHR